MEFLTELVFELLFDSAQEIANNPRTPKPLRIILGSVILLFMTAVVAIIAVVAIAVLGEQTWLGVLLIIVDVVFVACAVRKFIKAKNKR